MATTTVAVQTAAGGGNTIKSIQRGTIAISATSNTSATATITSVSTTKSVVNFLNWSCNTGGQAQDNYHPYVTLTNATTVTATIGTTISGGIITASFEVIEFN